MIRVGSRIRVSSYYDPVLSADDIHVLIRPSPAFGDGAHATTQMCLEMLELELEGGERVCDIGTGSGVLAIAAAKLGARTVFATDIDWGSCKAAALNIRANHAERTIHLFHGSVDAIHPAARFELVVTNLYNAQQVKDVLPGLAHIVGGQGKIICSGIWIHRGEEITRLLADMGFTLRHQRTRDAYIALSAVKEM